MRGILILSLLCLPAAMSRAAGYRERDSVYAAAGEDCRKALFPRDTVVETSPGKFLCGGGFSYTPSDSSDAILEDSTLYGRLRERARQRNSLIATGHAGAELIEIRRDTVQVTRPFLPDADSSRTEIREGRLSAAEAAELDSLVRVAPWGYISSIYLIDSDSYGLWICAYGTRTLWYMPGPMYITGTPMRDLGGLVRFLSRVSERIAGPAVERRGPTLEELEQLNVD